MSWYTSSRPWGAGWTRYDGTPILIDEMERVTNALERAKRRLKYTYPTTVEPGADRLGLLAIVGHYVARMGSGQCIREFDPPDHDLAAAIDRAADQIMLNRAERTRRRHADARRKEEERWRAREESRRAADAAERQRAARAEHRAQEILAKAAIPRPGPSGSTLAQIKRATAEVDLAPDWLHPVELWHLFPPIKEIARRRLPCQASGGG